MSINGYAKGYILRDVEGVKELVHSSGDIVKDWNMNGAPIFGYADDDPNRPVCYAYLSQENRRCQNPQHCPITGRCRAHSNLIKHIAESYKGERVGKTLPSSFQADYDRVSQDADYLGTKEDIHIHDVILERLLYQMEQSNDPEIWDSLEYVKERMKQLLASGQWEEATLATKSLAQQLISVVEQGSTGKAIRSEIREQTKLVSALKKQQVQFLITQAGMMTAEQVAAMITMITTALTSEIALVLPGQAGEMLVDNIVHRIGGMLNGSPTRPDVTVINGIPLQEVQPTQYIHPVEPLRMIPAESVISPAEPVKPHSGTLVAGYNVSTGNAIDGTSRGGSRPGAGRPFKNSKP